MILLILTNSAITVALAVWMWKRGYKRGAAEGAVLGYSRGRVEGLNAGVEQGKAVERARAENIAIATEADRKAAIRLNRSNAQKRRYAKARGEA